MLGGWKPREAMKNEEVTAGVHEGRCRADGLTGNRARRGKRDLTQLAKEQFIIATRWPPHRLTDLSTPTHIQRPRTHLEFQLPVLVGNPEVSHG